MIVLKPYLVLLNISTYDFRHVFSLFDLKMANRYRITPCFICRSVGTFVPLTVVLIKDKSTETVPTNEEDECLRTDVVIRRGPPAYAFDTCGHMVDEEGAKMWSRIVKLPVTSDAATQPRTFHELKQQQETGGKWKERWRGLFGKWKVSTRVVCEESVGNPFRHVCPYCLVRVQAARKLYFPNI